MKTTLNHPGPAAPDRVVSVHALSGARLIRLTPGHTIVSDLSDALESMHANSGYAELFGGDLKDVSYCVPTQSTDPTKIVGYSETRHSGPSQLINASATIGRRAGRPYLHCHAFWIDAESNNVAGHLWADTHAGSDPPYAAVYGLSGVRWENNNDAETNMPVFTPQLDRDPQMFTPDKKLPAIRTLVSRIGPNEEIYEAITQASSTAGFKRAVVRAGLGSFIGATFINRETGKQWTVDGPGTEVVSLVGRIDHADTKPSLRLSATLVDRHGVVHAGELLPGGNRVAVTFELTLQEIA